MMVIIKYLKIGFTCSKKTEKLHFGSMREIRLVVLTLIDSTHKIGVLLHRQWNPKN
jgi:hypothetical protein